MTIPSKELKKLEKKLKKMRLKYPKVRKDCVHYEGRKSRKFIICSYWECGGEPLTTWKRICHKYCLRYRKK